VNLLTSTRVITLISTRNRSSRKADRHYGRGEVDRKLAALEAFNKHHPEKRKKIKSLIKANRR
jgi:hypothetical protein